ncbi:MAG: hypothetical protein HEQ32_00535 [Vampirovibrio sp.]
MAFSLASLVLNTYSPQGSTSWQASQKGNSSFLNLMMLKELNGFWEDYDFWTLATESQSAGSGVDAEPIASSVSPPVPRVTLRSKASSPSRQNPLDVPKISSARKQVPVLQGTEKTAPVSTALPESQNTSSSLPPEDFPPSTSLGNLPLNMPPPQGFFPWRQDLASGESPGKGSKAGSADGRFTLNASLDKAFRDTTPRLRSSAGKDPTPTERAEFLQFLQLQMEEAHKKGKPFRVEVDDQTSVVLSLKKGEVSASFLMKDASEHQLKQVQQQLQYLKQSLQARRLPVSVLEVVTDAPSTAQGRSRAARASSEKRSKDQGSSSST